ncbi:hypothetical protein BH24ACT3_BH24ACT3_19020 [soil metagenome]
MADERNDPEHQRLDEVGETIGDARRTAEEEMPGIDDPDDQKFVDSGTERPEDDDQTIVPPG